MKKLKQNITIRSSAAEYLTFVAAGGNGGVDAVYADENIWLTQRMLGILYDVETHTINYHLKKVFADSELEEAAVIRNFRITALIRWLFRCVAGIITVRAAPKWNLQALN